MEITPEMQAEIDRQVQAGLAEIKSKLDAAYARRDEAVQALEAAKTGWTTERNRLESEAITAREAARKTAEDSANELKKRVESLEQVNSELSREKLMSSALAGFTFRNSRAAEVARSELANLMKQTDKGWVTMDGRPVEEVARELLAKEDFEFLLKPAPSSGAGTTGKGDGAPPANAGGSLLGKSSEEILQHFTKQHNAR